MFFRKKAKKQEKPLTRPQAEIARRAWTEKTHYELESILKYGEPLRVLLTEAEVEYGSSPEGASDKYSFSGHMESPNCLVTISFGDSSELDFENNLLDQVVLPKNIGYLKIGEGWSITSKSRALYSQLYGYKQRENQALFPHLWFTVYSEYGHRREQLLGTFNVAKEQGQLMEVIFRVSECFLPTWEEFMEFDYKSLAPYAVFDPFRVPIVNFRFGLKFDAFQKMLDTYPRAIDLSMEVIVHTENLEIESLKKAKERDAAGRAADLEILNEGRIKKIEPDEAG